jgi:hypothetical protein
VEKGRRGKHPDQGKEEAVATLPRRLCLSHPAALVSRPSEEPVVEYFCGILFTLRQITYPSTEPAVCDNQPNNAHPPPKQEGFILYDSPFAR